MRTTPAAMRMLSRILVPIAVLLSFAAAGNYEACFRAQGDCGYNNDDTMNTSLQAYCAPLVRCRNRTRYVCVGAEPKVLSYVLCVLGSFVLTCE